MNVYGTKQIRNVVLLGHGGAGKTTVAEALALVTGTTKRMGKVPEGTTISDYDKEEIKRQFSISTTLIPLEYQGEDGPIKINLLDTPGYFDFVGEVEEAISVACSGYCCKLQSWHRSRNRESVGALRRV